MSHKYYGFQALEEDSLYTVPFLSTKAQRLRFLNNDFVGYGDKNEFIIHKNPGLTIVRLSDRLIETGFHKQSNRQKLMNEFLNQLLQKSNEYTTAEKLIHTSGNLNIKQININSSSLIRITLSGV